jgi:hypothetical protein
LTNASSKAISIGNTIVGAKTNDVFIGNNIGVIGNSTGNNTYFGSSITLMVGYFNAFSVIGFFGGYNGLVQTAMFQATHMLSDIIFFLERIMIYITLELVQIYSLV